MNIKSNSLKQNYTGNMVKKNDSVNNDELRDKLAVNCAKMLSMDFENILPENGDFSPRRFSFDIPGTLNKAIYSAECDPTNKKDGRTFSIGAARKGSDKLISFLVCAGTKNDIIKFLSNDENAELFKSRLKEASDSIDESFS